MNKRGKSSIYIENPNSEQLAQLQLLAQTSLRLNQMKTTASVADYVCHQVKSIIAKGYVTVSLMDNTMQTMSVEAMQGFDDDKLINAASRLTGTNPLKMQYSLKDMTAEELALFTSGRLQLVKGGLYIILARKFPKAICAAIEHLINIRFVYAMGFVHHQTYLGGIFIMTDSERAIESNSFIIENIVAQSAAILSRIHTEDMLSESAERFSQVTDNADEWIWEVDADGIYRYCSPAVEKILGYTPDDLVGNKHFYDLFTLETREELKKAAFAAFQKQQPLRKLINPNLHKNGTTVFLETNGSPILDENGNLRGYRGADTDITERKQDEEGLKNAANEWSATFDSISDMVSVLDKEHRIVRVNKRFADVLKTTPQELVGKHCYRVTHGAEQASPLCPHVKAMETMKPETVEYFEPRLGIHIEETASPLFSVTGQPIGAVHIMRDISERKWAEEELRESEEKFKYFFDNSAVGKSFTSISGEIHVNKAFCEMLGYPEETLVNKPWQEITYADDIDPAQKIIDSLLSGEKKTARFVKRFIHKNGSIVWADVLTSLRRDSAGKPLYFMTSLIDITERKQAEEKFRSLFMVGPDALWVGHVADGLIMEVNKNMEELYGYSRDELVGKTSLELGLWVNPSDRQTMVRESNETGYSRVETIARKKNGEQFYCTVSVKSLLLNDEQCIVGAIQDTTKAKQAEDKLIASEIRYRRLFEAAKDGILILDAETGMIVDVNPFLIELLGFSHTEFMGKKVWELGFLKDIVANQANFVELQQKGYIRYEDLPIETADGRRIHVEFVSNAYTVEHTKVIQCNIRDITERKQAEKEILRLNQLYGVTSHVNQAVVRITTQEELLETVCRVIAEHGGFKLAWVGQIEPESNQVVPVAAAGPARDYVNGIVIFTYDSRPEGRGPVGTCIRELKPFVQNDFINDPNTQPWRERARSFGFHGSAAFPIFKEGQVWGALVVYSGEIGYFGTRETKLLEEAAGDIGFALDNIDKERQRKVAAKILKESEEKFKNLADQSPNIIFIHSGKNIVYANKIAEQLMGYSLEELYSPEFNFLCLIAPEFHEQIKASFVEHMNGKEAHPLEYVVVTKTGMRIEVILTTKLIDYRGQRAILGTITDISERKKSEAERQYLEEKAHISSRLAAVGEMASGIAHEINNPLTSVLGFSQLLSERQDLPSDVQQELKIISDGSERVREIVKRILTFARQNKPMRTRSNIHELIDNTLEIRSYVLKTASIEIIKNYEPDLPWLLVDAGQMQQVFLNLIVNAEQAMKKAHGKGRLVITTKNLDSHIQISFKDDGEGIRPETLSKLFQPFFTTKQVGEGTGLGLSISRSIIEEHGGTIRVESYLSEGAEFIITLPKTPFANEAGLQTSKTDSAEPPEIRKAHILVVDDEDAIRKLISVILSRNGHIVETTGDAGEASAKLENLMYDAIILDIRMPGINGMELYSKITKKHPELENKIVFITGDTSDYSTRSFIEKNRVTYITKPFDSKTLLEKVNSILIG